MNTDNIKYWLEVAQKISEKSKDPSTKIGALAIGEHNQILSTGYNGFPRKIADTNERFQNRELKYKYVLHAESNLITNACLAGTSLYNSTIFVFGLPVCSECAKLLIQIQPKAIYSLGEVSDRWIESTEFSKDLFKEAGIQYHHLSNIGNY